MNQSWESNYLADILLHEMLHRGCTDNQHPNSSCLKMKTNTERWFVLGVEDNHRKHGDVIFQWLFLVPLKGGRWHIIPQLAVYTTYIPLIYWLLGGYMLPTIFYGNQKQALKTWRWFFCWVTMVQWWTDHGKTENLVEVSDLQWNLSWW